jgi:hypothetical protein
MGAIPATGATSASAADSVPGRGTFEGRSDHVVTGGVTVVDTGDAEAQRPR